MSSEKYSQNYKKIKNFFLYLIKDPLFRISLIITIPIIVLTVMTFLFEKDKNNNIQNIFDSFWFIFVSLTTTGYGDITPATILGRLIGIFTMVFGVIIVAYVTGQIASFFIDIQLRREKGLLKLDKLKNHFIICGWKTDFENIVDGILDANPEFDPSEIVLLNSSSQYMEIFTTNPKYKMINYIYGDFIEESILNRANIKQASRVLILADQSSNYSLMEIDSRTIMAVLTITNLNRNLYIAAELLDEKFEKYLKVTHCDEVILTREYERKLLVNASSGTGVSHVIRDLLSFENKKGIIIANIPEIFIGNDYKNVFEYFLNQKNTILIGILENTGNFYSRKKEALVEAQKTTDISKSVDNLRKIKEFQSNKSILVPESDYKIKKHSKAIIVGKTTNL